VIAGAQRPVHAAEAANALFSIEAASFAVNGRTLLHPLDLTLPQGRVTGLIGHNGSGKSTLIKLLGRQQAPTQGVIRFLGAPLVTWRARDFARHVAYLPQQPAAATGLSVRELVAFGRYPWHGPLGRFGATDRQKVDKALELTDISSFADRVVDTLSGGERQRAWLAMLIAQDAQCLLLDEPISALDIAHQIEVLALVRRLSDERGMSVVVVLHDINMAARYCDEIIALHSGRMIDGGTPEEIMTPARLEGIYGRPMAVLAHPDTARPLAVPR
jgi:iron-chelate-transporting ATPase